MNDSSQEFDNSESYVLKKTISSDEETGVVVEQYDSGLFVEEVVSYRKLDENGTSIIPNEHMPLAYIFDTKRAKHDLDTLLSKLETESTEILANNGLSVGELIQEAPCRKCMCGVSKRGYPLLVQDCIFLLDRIIHLKEEVQKNETEMAILSAINIGKIWLRACLRNEEAPLGKRKKLGGQWGALKNRDYIDRDKEIRRLYSELKKSHPSDTETSIFEHIKSKLSLDIGISAIRKVVKRPK